MSTANAPQPTGNLPAPNKNLQTLNHLLVQMKPQLKMALPRHLTPDRMIRVAITAWHRTPALQECSPMSILGAVVQAAQLGLEPDSVLGHAYLVPFYNSKTRMKECQLITGYKGLLELSRRSGQIAGIDSRVVYARDHFLYRLGLEPKLEHVPADMEDRGEVVYAWALARFKDGAAQFEIMSRSEIDRIMKSSKAADFGPWKTHYEEMARKTVLRRLCKFLPLSPEIQRQVSSEEMADAGIIESTIIDQIDLENPPSMPPTGRTSLRNGTAEPNGQQQPTTPEQPTDRDAGADDPGDADEQMRREDLCRQIDESIDAAISHADLASGPGSIMNANREFLGDAYDARLERYQKRYAAIAPKGPPPAQAAPTGATTGRQRRTVQ